MLICFDLVTKSALFQLLEVPVTNPRIIEFHPWICLGFDPSSVAFCLIGTPVCVDVGPIVTSICCTRMNIYTHKLVLIAVITFRLSGFLLKFFLLR